MCSEDDDRTRAAAIIDDAENDAKNRYPNDYAAQAGYRIARAEIALRQAYEKLSQVQEQLLYEKL